MSQIIRIHAHGGPEVMRLEDVAPAAPGPGEIRLAQAAIGVNFRDIYVRKGLYAGPPLPSSLGFEGAGVVDAVGAGVTRFKAGDCRAWAQ